MEFEERCRKIKLLLFDVDGTATDGTIYFGPTGEALKGFHVRDGLGLKIWHEAGFRSGIISGRRSPMVDLRGSQLGVQFIRQGYDVKLVALEEILKEAKVSADECAFVGDDTPDIEVMERVGVGFAVADAHEEVRKAARYITKVDGGRGAIREVIDLLMKISRP
jgi:YrbI family 3-deoxy-D-manno-octulosonate 8-phosphate phosphatase